MSNFLARRAVVIGGGIGGLSVAGALAGHFEQVDVLERDRLPASAESQDRHPPGSAPSPFVSRWPEGARRDFPGLRAGSRRGRRRLRQSSSGSPVGTPGCRRTAKPESRHVTARLRIKAVHRVRAAASGDGARQCRAATEVQGDRDSRACRCCERRTICVSSRTIEDAGCRSGGGRIRPRSPDLGVAGHTRLGTAGADRSRR